MSGQYSHLHFICHHWNTRKIVTTDHFTVQCQFKLTIFFFIFRSIEASINKQRVRSFSMQIELQVTQRFYIYMYQKKKKGWVIFHGGLGQIPNRLYIHTEFLT